MLEQKIDDLIASLDRNTAALGGAKPGKAATTAAPATNGAATGKSKVTFDMVKAAVVKVKDEAGKPAAQKIIKEAGKAAELAGIKPAQFQAVIDACEAMLSEPEPEAEGDEGEDSL